MTLCTFGIIIKILPNYLNFLCSHVRACAAPYPYRIKIRNESEDDRINADVDVDETFMSKAITNHNSFFENVIIKIT